MDTKKYLDTVKALHNYEAKDGKCISFKKGDIIAVLAQDKSGWWNGVCNGKQGWFPSNFVASTKDGEKASFALKDEVNSDPPRLFREKSSPELANAAALVSNLINMNEAIMVKMSAARREEAKPVVARRALDQTPVDAPVTTPEPIQTNNSSCARTPVKVRKSPSADFDNAPSLTRGTINMPDEPKPIRRQMLSTSNSLMSLSGHSNQGSTTSVPDRALPRSTSTDSNGPLSKTPQNFGELKQPYQLKAASLNSGTNLPRALSPLPQAPQPIPNSSVEKRVNRLSADLSERIDKLSSAMTLEICRRITPNSGQLALKTPAQLPENWRSKTTPDGQVYYFNLTTMETTYDLNQVMLMAAEPDQDQKRKQSRTLQRAEIQVRPRSRRSSVTGWTPTEDNMIDSNTKPTWDLLINNILGGISRLNEAAKMEDKINYIKCVQDVITAIRDMMISSGTVNKDAPIVQMNRSLKSHHHNIMSSLSKLVLASKVASGIWPPPDGANKMRFQAGQVLLAIRHFVATAQESSIVLQTINQAQSSTIEFDAKGSELSDIEFVGKVDQYAEVIVASLSTLVAKVRAEKKVSEGIIQHTRQTVTEIGQLLSLLEEIHIPEQRDVAGYFEITNEFKDKRVIVFNTTMDLTTAARAAMDPFAPGSTLVTVKQIATHLVSLVETLIMATKILIDQLNVLEERTMQDEVEFYDLASKRDSDLLQLQRRAMSLTFLNKSKSEDSLNMLPSDNSTGASPAANKHIEGGFHTSQSSNMLGNFSVKDNAPIIPNFNQSTASRQRKIASTGDIPGMQHSKSIDNIAAQPSIPYRKESSDKEVSKWGGVFRIAKWLGQDNEPTKPPGQHNMSPQDSTNSPNDRTPWYLNHETQPKDTSFSSEGALLGSTFLGLVERITIHDATPDPIILNSFLMTFHLFSTANELLDALEKRFFLTQPRGLAGDEARIWKERKLFPIRLRVFNALKIWIEMYWSEEHDNPVMIRVVSMADRINEVNNSLGERLHEIIRKRNSSTDMARELNRVFRQQAQILSNDQPDCPSPILPKSFFNVEVLDLDATEIARQLTLMDCKMFCQILAKELLGQEWTKKDSKAVNVKAMSTFSTKLSEWVVQAILADTDPKRRSAVLRHFIKIAEKCRLLNNFNTLMALVAALQTSSIVRLKKTWEGLPNKYRAIMDNLLSLTDHRKNFSEYRNALKNSPPPALPFIGIHLTDIVFTEDGNPPTRAEGRLINFDRNMRIAKIIQDFQKYQVPFNLIEVKEIQEWLRREIEGIKQKGVEELYRLSVLLEPRSRSNDNLSGSFTGTFDEGDLDNGIN